MFAFLALALGCSSSACATETTDPNVADEAPVEASVTETSQQPGVATEAKLIEFDGAALFLKTSQRLRIWRDVVEFDLTVDPQGHPSGCEVVNRFRSNYVNLSLCKVVLKHHTFEPARDAQNQPVEGTYHARFSYADLRAQLD